MKQPEKWRETIDPFSLPYQNFLPMEILGYPHAGNDVFHVRGMLQDKEITAYVKAARQVGAAIENEMSVLSQLHAAIYPTVIDYGFEGIPFLVTTELPGERLSTILGENDSLNSMTYLSEYGATLAKLHQLRVAADKVKDRKFFHAPSNALLEASGLSFLSSFFAEAPKNYTVCFCHGDFHYANVLWDHGHISGILDFELAGYGDRDFDIAWAIFRRPGQKFLKTVEEQQEFLRGYAQHGDYNMEAVKYYMAQCYVYFLQFSGEDAEYCAYVRAWLSDSIGEMMG